MNKKISKYDDLILYSMLCGKKSEAEDAFAELYARYSQRIYSYCLRTMGTPEDAKDIFQEAFLKFFDSAKSNTKVENIPAYLLKITRNICLNFKRDKRIVLNIDDFHVSTNDQGYEQKELLQLLSMALDVLEFDYREAFVLRQYQGLTYKEISAITGESISAIKNRVWRAKEKIKEILTPYLEDMSNNLY